MGLDVLPFGQLPPDRPALVVDGILGYGARGDPWGAAAALIQWANRSAAPVLSLDHPSGLDDTAGRIGIDVCSGETTVKAAQVVNSFDISEVRELR